MAKSESCKAGEAIELRSVHRSIEIANEYLVTEKKGTQNDALDMDRMGKLQQLQVDICITHSSYGWLTISAIFDSCRSLHMR